jgi:hypothetical protein
MKIASNIKFDKLAEPEVFDNTTSEYKTLDKLNDNGEWKEYVNDRLAAGISVIYDATGDYFAVKPMGFKPEKKQQNENSNRMTTKNSKFPKFLNEDEDKYLLFDDEDPDKDEEDLEGDEETEVLPGKDVEDVDIESPTTDLTSIDDDSDIEVADVAPAVEENTGGISVEDIQRIVDEMLNQRVGSTINSDVEETVPANDALANSGSTVTDNITGVFDAASSSDFAEVQDRLGVVKDKIANDESYADILNGDDAGQDAMLEKGSDEMIGEEDYSDEAIGGSTLPPAEYADEVETYEPPITDEVTSYQGEPITITIKGWIISQSEINSLAESVKKSGGKLKKIGSPNKSELYLFVEAAGKKYKIKYEDRPYIAQATPWSIGQHKFTSLKEAIGKAKNSRPISNKERFLKSLVLENKDIYQRKMTNLRESDIFADFRQKQGTESYIQSWNVKSVGSLNLKSGLNETYSNITKHAPSVKNTLVGTADGKYYLIKGNLNESVGTKKHIVDLNARKDYGVCQIIGLYENSVKGMGQIMQKIQRTGIHLFTWR